MRAIELDYHAARVLLLIASFTADGRTGMDGLTKLAKLDFLVRYPVLMERLAAVTDRPSIVENGKPSTEEKLAVESRMIRYKYGPWDDRYYPIVGILIGLGLVQPMPGRGRAAFRATDKGLDTARRLAHVKEWQTAAARCEYVASNFDLTGSRLKDLIYQCLPDVVDRPHRAVI
jgi:hypothetical protein